MRMLIAQTSFLKGRLSHSRRLLYIQKWFALLLRTILLSFILFSTVLFANQSALQKSFEASALNTFSMLTKELNDKKGKSFVVVIDAGHGGKDPGALGRNGAREKDVVLKIEKILAKKMIEWQN